MSNEEERKKKRRTPYIFYSLLLAAALVTAVSTLSQAANFVNTDGYINLSASCTNLTNGTCTINYNTTRYAGPTSDGILNSTDWIRFNSSTGSNTSDGNNYTTSQSFERSSNNIILQTARNGMSNVSAFFTLQSTTGIITTNGITYANATNCSSGQYSRYEENGWNCYNDASGGSGTVTSINVTTTSDNNSVYGTGGPVTTTGTINLLFYNATSTQTGLLKPSDYNTFSNKVPYTGATSNVTLGSYGLKTHSIGPDASDGLIIQAANALTVASFGVGNTNNSLFYGSISLFNGQNICLSGVCRSTWPNESYLYQNVTDLQNSNTITNTRINTINTTVQNLLTSNNTLFGLILQLGQNDTSINNSISTLSTFAQTKAATGYSGDCPTGIAGITINNGTAPNKTCAPAQSGGGSGMTSFGIKSGATNATITNSSTFNLYGSGVSINVSGSGADSGATITVSAGGGNISGGSSNGTLGFAAIWNSTTTITNSSLYINAQTGAVLAGAYGSTSNPLFASALNPDSGYYTDSAGQFMVTCDGNKCFQANNDGIQTAQGSSVFPGIQSTTDDDTGPYWASDNVWAVTAAGNAGGGQVISYSVNGTHTNNATSISTQNTTSTYNTTRNNTIALMAVNIGLNRPYISPMQKNQNYFPEIDTILNPTYTAHASALSGTTAATQTGPGGGAALALAVGSIYTNIAPAWAGPMLSCITGTAYNASCGYGRSTLYNTRLAGFYMTGTVVPITIGTTAATGQNIFAGLQSSVTLTSAGNNLTSQTWATNYSTSGSYIGFMINQNATNGLGNSWHFIASNAATNVKINTTINLTAGHAYTYGINCPPSNSADQCYGWMRDTNSTAIEGRGEFIGNLSVNLPAAATTLSPVAVMTSKSGTAKTMYVSGFKVVTFPWDY